MKVTVLWLPTLPYDDAIVEHMNGYSNHTVCMCVHISLHPFIRYLIEWVSHHCDADCASQCNMPVLSNHCYHSPAHETKIKQEIVENILSAEPLTSRTVPASNAVLPRYGLPNDGSPNAGTRIAGFPIAGFLISFF